MIAHAQPYDFLSDGRSFDHYARLVRRLLRVPVALVSIVESERQVFPGVFGLPEPYRSARQTPLSHSFCQYVVADAEPLIVTDARLDPRLADNLAIPDLGVIAYAGWPLLDSAGRAIGSLCAIDHTPREWTAEDIQTLEDLALGCSAELQQAVGHAREGEDLARAIFESVDVAMAFFNNRNELVLANALAERAASLAGAELDQPPFAGPHVRRADNQTPIPFEDQIIPRALRGDLEHHEMEWIGPPGNQVAIKASAQQVFRADGTLRGTLLAAHNVTDLARSIQVKDEFVATVSHELRTPLTSILGYVELLEDLDSPDPFIARAVETIRRNALNLQQRIAELLDTADRRRALQLEPTDMALLTQRLLSTLGEQAKRNDIALRVDATDCQWATVDPRRIEQALENVVSNAIKYTRAGGHVTVTTIGEPDAVTILVTDNGIGMSNDEVNQAFDTFYRGDSARNEAVQGIGIGLTIVRDILTAHQGTIHLDSVPDEGTTVTLTIPRSTSRPTG